MRNSRASLFLMELMISILFFSLSSAVCIQLFVKAYTINEATENKSNATLIAQDISEYFHHASGDKEQFLKYFGEYEDAGDIIILYFSQNGINCHADNAYYIATLCFSQEASFRVLTLELTRQDDNVPLYSSTLKKYIQSTL